MKTKPCKKCSHCASVFLIRKTEGQKMFSERKFCSLECYHKSRVIKTEPKLCRVCGAIFNKKAGSSVKYYNNIAKYCSSACLTASQQKYINSVQCSVCSREIKPNNTSRRRNKSFYCSKNCYANYLKQQTQEKAPRWDGGKTKLTLAIRTGHQYKEWRSGVFNRDNYTCTHCKQRGGKLEADHIITVSNIVRAFNIKNIKEARENFFLWEISNGRTLCESCHKRRHRNMV